MTLLHLETGQKRRTSQLGGKSIQCDVTAATAVVPRCAMKAASG